MLRYRTDAFYERQEKIGYTDCQRHPTQKVAGNGVSGRSQLGAIAAMPASSASRVQKRLTDLHEVGAMRRIMPDGWLLLSGLPSVMSSKAKTQRRKVADESIPTSQAASGAWPDLRKPPLTGTDSPSARKINSPSCWILRGALISRSISFAPQWSQPQRRTSQPLYGRRCGRFWSWQTMGHF